MLLKDVEIGECFLLKKDLDGLSEVVKREGLKDVPVFCLRYLTNTKTGLTRSGGCRVIRYRDDAILILSDSTEVIATDNLSNKERDLMKTMFRCFVEK